MLLTDSLFQPKQLHQEDDAEHCGGERGTGGLHGKDDPEEEMKDFYKLDGLVQTIPVISVICVLFLY